MVIKLNNHQYAFLSEHLLKEKPHLMKFFNSDLVSEIDEDSATEIRDWAGEKLQKEGFNIDYELNQLGIMLEQIEDLFYA